ncbi:SDR family NAD(P)-dependent oxidoreductase [Austwickia chelonae]|uniref:SDR family NAD(P)-dependent oxidoreductase n=1 Tax=Austwickia chelonae TaxID=100225 RepID=UPI000E265BB5|nr:SDR family oxidoreductase [Austwickia chelonae]
MPDAPWALVTGASRGLGSSLAVALARTGYQVVTCARSQERLEEQAEIARAAGLTLHPVVADVTDESSVDSLFTEVERLAGRLDLCVNNAGTNNSHQLVRATSDPEQLHRYPLQDWRTTIDLCLTGTFLVGRAAAAMMVRQSSGVIVNISSAVRHGAYGQSAYAAAKAGVESLTRTWSWELGEHGVRVVAIAPGVLDGERLRERIAASERHRAYMAALKTQTPLQRWAETDDVCDAVIFAASHDSVTGTVLEVHCGGIPPRVRI